MRLTRRTIITLSIFASISIVMAGIVGLYYAKLPAVYLGIGRYTVRVQLDRAGELYRAGNVTYRGVEVGKVSKVHLTNSGVEAVLSLKSDVAIPADLIAHVHSASAIGEQYVDLVPRSGKGPMLKNGDVIPQDRTTIPPNINSLLAAANRGLTAIPRDNLKTVVDESYIAFGGLGPELSRLIAGGSKLATGARENLDAITTLIDEPKPILDSQTESSDSIQAWAANLAEITRQVETVERNNSAFTNTIHTIGPIFDSLRKVVDRVEPTLPTAVSNLDAVGEVALTYRDNIEALLVQVPQMVADSQAIQLADKDLKGPYRGLGLSFNLNLNWPPPCTTGFFPVQQQRSAVFEDAPPRPPGLVYCRIPQDSNLTAVRGARNYPCETRPGKRAATVKQCESDEPYVPLNDGFNWKGDPNATLTGQGVPQFDPGEPIPAGFPGGPPAPAASPGRGTASPGETPPPIAAAEYDPATGEYVGPDGQRYKQPTLAGTAGKERTWQQMLTPPTGN
ncbi:MCE family protein [Mycobacterium palustre]|uniref:Mammalian cell entry protein n=1 Tax=Mycobacterium palustre TaxID=153971 RepID=A0A1X1ZIP9_9MYCO|nr:MlaD family protein [Mycobacterium palustre]MCV7102726.1 MCE family protein [Mycobacterium palustre]ORW23229.1 mammalian cell entry protein [Mycobacterium palustre]